MNILGWIVVGFIGGAIAKLIVPGRDPGGIILTILIGIAGAVVGGFLSILLGIGNGIDNFDRIAFWKTPSADCGNGENDCVAYSDWTKAYVDIVGGQ